MTMIIFPLLLQKPSRTSKSKDHTLFLERRLRIWHSGDIYKLLKECVVIQERLTKSKFTPDHHEKVFARLMLQGKVSAALRWNGSQRSSVLEVTEDVIDTLKSKHPTAAPVFDSGLIEGPILDVEKVIFESIDSSMIHTVAKKISGSRGPSGVDAEIWQQVLCSKQFKKKPEQLCQCISDLAKKLSCEIVDPDHLKSYTAGRLIPLDKKPGVRPIGVGEVLRRIVGKAVMTVLRADVVNCTAPIQLCGGLKGGVEAAIHAVRRIYEDPDTEAVMLIDADNAFNSLNRNVALNNLQYTCPEFFKYVLNTYRQPAELFVNNTDDIIESQEGTTQGDTSSMGLYACSLMPLIKSLRCDTPRDTYPKQVWYADDSAAGGSLDQIKLWWDDLQSNGPMFGYHPKPSKTWIIVKPAHIEAARLMFPEVNITTTGHRYLGSYIGDRSGLKDFIDGELESWKADISGLTCIASKEPQLAYAAFVYGSSKRWNFVCRTTPDISDYLKPLEYQIKDEFIPAIIGKLYIPDTMREIFSLPAKIGGMGIMDSTITSDMEYNNSVKSTLALTEAVYNQSDIYTENGEE